MDRRAWQAIVHVVPRVRRDLATKPPPPYLYYKYHKVIKKNNKTKLFKIVTTFSFLLCLRRKGKEHVRVAEDLFGPWDWTAEYGTP